MAEPWDIPLRTYREVPLSRKLCEHLAARGTPYVDEDIEEGALILSKAQIASLGEALKAFDDEDLDILELRFANGVSQEGVGLFFGISQGGISNREHKLLKRLRLLVQMRSITEDELRARLQVLRLMPPKYENLIELFVQYWTSGGLYEAAGNVGIAISTGRDRFHRALRFLETKDAELAHIFCEIERWRGWFYRTRALHVRRAARAEKLQRRLETLTL